MIILKQVIFYDKNRGAESTWVDRVVTPATGVEGEEDYTPEQIKDTTVRCHSYADCQMDMLRADLGADASEYEIQIASVEAAYVQPPVDYSDDTYDRKEQDDAPYVVYTKKSDEQIQAARWAKIKQKRDELTDNGGCLVGGKWFHTDTKSKQQQMALTMLGAAIPANLQWKTMDGTFITMTQTLAGQLFGAQIVREQAIFAHAEVLKADINADINSGWPARYEPA